MSISVYYPPLEITEILEEMVLRIEKMYEEMIKK